MPITTINRPRIDIGFVRVRLPDGREATGNLTQNAYKLISDLILRVGGVRAEALDMSGVNELLEVDDLAPRAEPPQHLSDDPAPYPAPSEAAEAPQDGRLQALEAEVAELREQINGILQGMTT